MTNGLYKELTALAFASLIAWILAFRLSDAVVGENRWMMFLLAGIFTFGLGAIIWTLIKSKLSSSQR